LAGDDTIIAGLNANGLDTLDGGEGVDRLQLQDSIHCGRSVQIQARYITQCGKTGIQYTNIEIILDTALDDEFYFTESIPTALTITSWKGSDFIRNDLGGSLITLDLSEREDGSGTTTISSYSGGVQMSIAFTGVQVIYSGIERLVLPRRQAFSAIGGGSDETFTVFC
jgi:hypothetical protein